MVLRAQKISLEELPLSTSFEVDTVPLSPSEVGVLSSPLTSPHEPHDAAAGDDSVKSGVKRNSLPRAVKQLWNKGSHHGKKSKEKQEKKQ